jgi:hypothetical protein
MVAHGSRARREKLMDAVTITILVLAILALGGWGYGYYTAPAPAAAVAPAPHPGLTLLGFLGLILIIAFVVLLATGWRFGLDIHPPQ